MPKPEHYKRFYAGKRTNYGRPWRRVSRPWLAEHPFCSCGAVATEVDHIIPHRGDEALFWDAGNWQALCKRCHDQKRGREVLGARSSGVPGRGVSNC